MSSATQNDNEADKTREVDIDLAYVMKMRLVVEVEDLQDLELGLGNPEMLLNLASKSFNEDNGGDHWGILPGWCLEGWGKLDGALDGETMSDLLALVTDPSPLLAALDRFPRTLVHGDFYLRNLASSDDDRPAAFDWQLSMCSLMTIDVARLLNDLYEDELRIRGWEHYRTRLEHHLGSRSEDETWNQMKDLGDLVDVLWITPFISASLDHEDRDRDGFARSRLAIFLESFSNGTRWL